MSLPFIPAVNAKVVVTWRYLRTTTTNRWFGVFARDEKKKSWMITYTGEFLRDGDLLKPFATSRGVLHDKICDWPPPANVHVISITPHDTSIPTLHSAVPPPNEPRQRQVLEKEELEARAAMAQKLRRLRPKVPAPPRNAAQKPESDGRIKIAQSEKKAWVALYTFFVKTSTLRNREAAARLKLLQSEMLARTTLGVAFNKFRDPAGNCPTDELFGDDDVGDLPTQTSVSEIDGAAHDREDVLEDLEDLVERLAEEPPPPFRCGNGANVPPVAALTGHDLIKMLQRGPPRIPSIAMLSLVKGTHDEHRRLLKHLATMPADLQKEQLPNALVNYLMRQRQSRNWRWSTTLKMFACCQGALAALPLYRDCIHPLYLKFSVVWTNSIKAAAREARQELPRQPCAAMWDQVRTVLRTEPSLPTFVAILLAWFSAARVGCILQLSRQDVTVHSDHSLTIRFQRGKSVLARGQCYSVHTPAIPEELRPRLLRWLDERRSLLFPMDFKGPTVKDALRRVDPRLEQRSLRRGSLQALARQPGMTDDMLMLFSGHSCVKTLRRYLNWGTAAHHTRTAMVTAAADALVS